MQQYVFNEKMYKNKLRKKSNFSFTIVFICIILLLGLAVYFKPTKQKTNKLYLIQINKFLTYTSANDLACELQALNGAGYIYFNDDYKVFSSLYLEKNDATNVVNNLKNQYPSSSIYTLELNQYRHQKSFNSKQNEAIKSQFETNQNVIYSSYKNTISFIKNEINADKLKLNFLNLKKDFDETSSNFKSQFKSDKKYLKPLEYLEKISATLSELCDTENYKEQKLQYNLISLAVNSSYFSFCF